MISPIVVGRKNWLFCDTQTGANASVLIYSVMETAKANGLKKHGDGALCFHGCQTNFLTIPKLMPVIRLACRMETPCFRSSRSPSSRFSTVND